MVMKRADLDSLILTYLERVEDEDAVAMVGGWIALAEADVRQRLRAPWMIRVATGTVQDISAPLDLAVETDVARIPDSYVAASSAFAIGDAGGGARELRFIAPSQLGDYLNRPGVPEYICIEGHFMQICPGSGPLRFRISYYSMGAPLSKPSDTNENLAHAVNVYLYSALHHAYVYYGDDDRASVYGAKADQMIENINALAQEWNAGTGIQIRRRR